MKIIPLFKTIPGLDLKELSKKQLDELRISLGAKLKLNRCIIYFDKVTGLNFCTLNFAENNNIELVNLETFLFRNQIKL